MCEGTIDWTGKEVFPKRQVSGAVGILFVVLDEGFFEFCPKALKVYNFSEIVVCVNAQAVWMLPCDI